jgi:translocation and assembly module TamB
MFGRVLFALGLAAAVIAAAAIAVARTDFVSNNLCAYAVATIEEVSSAHVRLARCSVDPARLQLALDGLEVGREHEPLHLTVARVFVHVRVSPLAQKVRLERLEVDHPALTLTLGGPAAPEKKKKPRGECLPPVLENFELGRVTVRKASVQLEDPGSGVKVVVPRASAELHSEGTGLRVRLVTKTGEFEQREPGPPRDPNQPEDFEEEDPPPGKLERSASLISARVNAWLDLRGTGTLEVTKADVIGTELSAFVTGKLQDLCDPKIDAAANVRVDDLTAATGRIIPGLLEGVAGELSVDASFEMRDFKPQLRGDLKTKALTLEGLSPGDVRAHFDLNGDRIKLEKLSIPTGPKGEITGKAELDFSAPGLPLAADLVLREMELAELLLKLGIPRSHVVLKASGKVAAKGTILPLQLSGEAALDLAEFAVLDRRFEQRAHAQRVLEFGKGRLATPIAITREKILLKTAKLDVQGSRLEIDGTFYTDVNRGMDLKGKGTGFALEDFRGHLGPIPIKGKATLTTTVLGPYTDPVIESQFSVDNFHFLDLALGDVSAAITFKGMQLDLRDIAGKKDRSTYTGKVSLDFDDEALPVIAHIELTDAWLHDLTTLAIGMVPTLSTVSNKEDVDGHVTGVLDAVGPVAGPDATARLSFDYVTMFGQTFADGDALFTLHGAEQRLQMERLVLRHGQALFKMAGRFGPRWELEMDAHTEKFDLADLDSGSAAELRGPLVSTMKMRGVASHPLIDTEVQFVRGMAGKAKVGDGAMSMRVDGKVMTWQGKIGTHTFSGAGRLEGDFGYTSTLALRFPDLTGYFQSFAPKAELQSGSASADVTVGGSLLQWRKSSGTVALSSLKFSRADLAFENDGPGLFAFGPEGFEIKRLGLRSSFLSLLLQGTRAADGKLDIHTSATIDGRLFATQMPDLEHASGTYSLQAAISGKQEAPSVLGNLRVEAGELRLRGLPLALRELSGSISFSQDALAIDSMEGKVNNGLAKLTGRMEFKALKPDRIDLALHMSDVNVKFQENLSATLDGDLTVMGQPLEPTLGGSLIVSRMKYTEDLDLERQMLDFKRRPPAPQVLDRGQALVHFDVDVHLSRGVRIENNLARADLKGDLKVTGTSRKLGLLGSVNMVRGTATFRGNDFTIEQGVMNFTDRSRIRPSFDFQANAQVKEYKVKLHSYGTFEDYKLQLTSDPGLAEADIGFLLTFGFVSQALQTSSLSAGDAGFALGVEALNKITGLSEEVRRIIPKNSILRDPNIDFVTDYSAASTGGASRLEPMARFRSHILSDKLELRVLEGLTTRRYRAVMAYQITDAVSSQVQFDNERLNGGTDLGVDLKLRWEGE